MAKIKVLFFLLLILELVPDSINNLNININVSGKSRVKTYQESCVSNSECGYGLSCISFICKCQSDEFWNNSCCVWKVVLYFTTSNYTTSQITNFNGSGFNFANDIKVIEQPDYYIYVSSENSNVVVQYDQYGSYIRHISVSGAFGLETVNNTSIYATRFNAATMYKFDTNLNVLINTVPANATYVQSPRFLRYNPSNGYIYVCDYESGYVNAFDLAYNRILSESLQFNIEELYGIDFYHSEFLGDLIFLTTISNSIKIVKKSDKTIYKILSPVCSNPKNLISAVLIHQKSGYFLISCYLDGIVQLWYTNGTYFFNTGKTISITEPLGMTSDSNGRLMIANFYDNSFIIFTPNV